MSQMKYIVVEPTSNGEEVNVKFSNNGWQWMAVSATKEELINVSKVLLDATKNKSNWVKKNKSNNKDYRFLADVKEERDLKKSKT